MEDYACHPSRDRVVVTAKVHKLTTYLDTQANELVLMISLVWAIIHYIAAYSYMGRMLYHRCMRKGDKNYAPVPQQSSNPEPNYRPDEPMGGDLQNVKRTY